jgi:hypothetical protein
MTERHREHHKPQTHKDLRAEVLYAEVTGLPQIFKVGIKLHGHTRTLYRLGTFLEDGGFNVDIDNQGNERGILTVHANKDCQMCGLKLIEGSDTTKTGGK